MFKRLLIIFILLLSAIVFDGIFWGTNETILAMECEECTYDYESPYNYEYQYESPSSYDYEYQYQYEYQSPGGGYDYQYEYQYEYQYPTPGYPTPSYSYQTPSAAQCSDGNDNDGDGGTDSGDSSCHFNCDPGASYDAGWDDESETCGYGYQYPTPASPTPTQTGSAQIGCSIGYDGSNVNFAVTCSGGPEANCGNRSSSGNVSFGDGSPDFWTNNNGGVSGTIGHSYGPGSYTLRLDGELWGVGTCSASTTVIIQGGPSPQCSDGQDNDNQEGTDAADPSCHWNCDAGAGYDPGWDDEGAVCTPPPSPQCSNGSDDDGDSKVDFPADPGCVNAADNDEFNAYSYQYEYQTPNSPPQAPNVTVIEPDYCSSGPSATIDWDFSDPDGGPQTAFRVQIDDDPAFGSPAVDTGKVISSGTIFSTGQGALSFNTTYRARVLVWDNQDVQCVSWQPQANCQGPGCAANKASWTTPQHAYPGNINFSFSPTNPTIKQMVQFNSAPSTCFAAGGFPTTCASWRWDFGDGTAVVSGPTQATPRHAFNSLGTFQTGLQVTDAQGYTCTNPAFTRPITVITSRFPQWKEILPQGKFNVTGGVQTTTTPQ